MTYITHARTLEELRAEVLSDLRRRIAFLDGQNRVIARGATEKSRNARAINELEAMLHYWTEVQLVRAKAKATSE